MIFEVSARQDEVKSITDAAIIYLSEDEFKNFGNSEALMHGRS